MDPLPLECTLTGDLAQHSDLSPGRESNRRLFSSWNDRATPVNSLLKLIFYK